MTPIEIIALVLAIGIILKLLCLINPKKWLSFVKSIYSNPALLIVVELVLAVVVFYYLLQELTIVQIFAVIGLGALLTGMSFAVFAKDMVGFAEKMLKQNVLKKAWLPILIWLILALWVLKTLFM